MSCINSTGNIWSSWPPKDWTTFFFKMPNMESKVKSSISPQNWIIYQRGTPALHLNEAADGSCCDAGLSLVWRCYWIFMSFVCLIPPKNICFGFLKGQGCVESKNKTSAKRKSTMSSLDPSIIQVGSFKCRADVPLTKLFFPPPSLTSEGGGRGDGGPHHRRGGRLPRKVPGKMWFFFPTRF